MAVSGGVDLSNINAVSMIRDRMIQENKELLLRQQQDAKARDEFLKLTSGESLKNFQGKLQDEQIKRFNDLNDYEIGIYKSSHGNPSLSEIMSMKNKQAEFEGWQGDISNAFKEDQEAVSKMQEWDASTKYNLVDMQQKHKEFRESGKIPQDGFVTPLPFNLNKYVNDTTYDRPGDKKIKREYTETLGKKKIHHTEYTIDNEKWGQPLMRDLISNPNALTGIGSLFMTATRTNPDIIEKYKDKAEQDPLFKNMGEDSGKFAPLEWAKDQILDAKRSKFEGSSEGHTQESEPIGGGRGITINMGGYTKPIYFKKENVQAYGLKDLYNISKENLSAEQWATPNEGAVEYKKGDPSKSKLINVEDIPLKEAKVIYYSPATGTGIVRYSRKHSGGETVNYEAKVAMGVPEQFKFTGQRSSYKTGTIKSAQKVAYEGGQNRASDIVNKLSSGKKLNSSERSYASGLFDKNYNLTETGQKLLPESAKKKLRLLKKGQSFLK